MEQPSGKNRGWLLLAIGGTLTALLCGAGVRVLTTAGYSGAKGLLDSLAADRSVQSFSPSAYFWIVVALCVMLLSSIALVWFVVRNRERASLIFSSLCSRIRLEFGVVQDGARIDRQADRQTPSIRVAVLLFAIFLPLYFGLGAQLAATHAFERNELMFDSDAWIVIRNLTQFRSDHTHCNVHPLFCVLFNPPGILLKRLLGSDARAAVLLASTAGAMTVSSAYVFMFLLGASSTIATLWSAALGLSASQMFFAAVPETYSFAPIGFLALCIVLLRRPDHVLAQCAMIAYVLGITATNALPALLLALIPFAMRARNASRALKRGIALVGGACALVVIPNILQVVLYRTWPFFLPWAYTSKRAWTVSLATIGDAGLRVSSLVHAMLMESFVAPRLRLRLLGVDYSESVRGVLSSRVDNGYVPTVTLSPDWVAGLTPVGIALSIAWVGVLVWCALRSVGGLGPRHPLAYGLAGALVLQLMMHTVFGRDLFLYSGHWTVLVWGLAGTTIARVQDRKATHIGVILLLGLLAINSVRFLDELHSVFTY